MDQRASARKRIVLVLRSPICANELLKYSQNQIVLVRIGEFYLRILARKIEIEVIFCVLIYFLGFYFGRQKVAQSFLVDLFEPNAA